MRVACPSRRERPRKCREAVARDQARVDHAELSWGAQIGVGHISASNEMPEPGSGDVP